MTITSESPKWFRQIRSYRFLAAETPYTGIMSNDVGGPNGSRPALTEWAFPVRATARLSRARSAALPRRPQ